MTPSTPSGLPEPLTKAGVKALDHMEFIRDPEEYRPGNVGRGYFWDDDVPLVLAIEREAVEAYRLALADRVQKIGNDNSDDLVWHNYNSGEEDLIYVARAAVLRLLEDK